MVVYNHCLTNGFSTDTLTIHLTGISGVFVGFGYIKIHGQVEFKINYHQFEKLYCSDMMDGVIPMHH